MPRPHASVTTFAPDYKATLAAKIIRFFPPLFIMGLRGLTLISKFALTLFITHSLGLSDLGLYGLVVGATTLMPAFIGLGLTGPTQRHVVDMPFTQAMPYMFTRMLYTVGVNAIVMPLFFGLNEMLGRPVPLLLAGLIAGVVFLEHLATDVHGQLVSRHRAALANVLLFLRGGAWPLLFMVLAWCWPQLNSLNYLMFCWLAGLVSVWLVLVGFLARNARWRAVGLRRRWLRQCVWRSWPFYLFDIGSTGSQYIDRFIINHFMGLEVTGVYVFFWSIANAINSLIYFGVTQVQTPKLIGLAKQGKWVDFQARARRLLREIWGWGLGLSLPVCTAMPWLLDYLQRPQLKENLWLFWLIMAATLVRLADDGLNNLLYAASRDKTMAFVSLCGIAVSASVLGAGTALWGLSGAAWAAVIAAGVSYGMRSWGTRPLWRAKVRG